MILISNFSRVFNCLRIIGLTVIISLLFLSDGAVAQDTVTGAFQGAVTNYLTGDAMAGATVEITNERSGVTSSLITDSRGQFYQGLLPPGIYQIRVTITGFKPRLLRHPLNVSRTGEVVPVPISLEPEIAGVTQPSQVILEEANDIRIEINTTDARRDGSFKDDTITKIPLGSTTITRSFDELALLLPGVAPPPQTVGDIAGPGVGAGVGSAGQFAVNGLRSRGNNFTVDGSDNNDEDIGVRRQGFVALTSQPIESVQEFQIITLLAPAQFGRNIGAQVNIVSKAGGNKLNGSLYGFFNSNRLNARNFFDTTNGNNAFALKSTSGQSVLLDGQPLMVRNGSGGEDSFTSAQGGGTVGGAIVPNKLFYFLSGEYQKINATQEKNFVVPTIEERGFNRTGASGIFRNIFPTEVTSSSSTTNAPAVLSLLPFSNNPTGTFGENTFTQSLPASGRGIILSGRIDNNFKFAGRQQTATARYNFTDDKRIIPAINEAIFSSVLSKTQTRNFSFFLNSQLNRPDSGQQLSNQVRFSLGRTGLNFSEVRDTEYLIPSDNFSHIPFLLNAPLIQNITRPESPGVPNTGPVQFRSGFIPCDFGPMFCPIFRTVEQLLRPVGQVIINGFSPIGTDVYNFPQTRVNNTYQLADELSLRLQNHTLVFGADVRRTDLNSDLPSLSRPLLIFNGGLRLIPDSTFEGRLPTLADQNPIFSAIDMVSVNAASSFRLNFNVDRPDSKVDLRYYQFNFYGQDAWRVRKNLSVSYGLRYEYNSPVHEVNGLIEQTFSDPRTSQFSGLSTFIDGRKTLYDADKNNFAPRVGIAYSPKLFGDSRPSVFRAGYGIFYDQILGAVVNQSRNVFPTFTAVDFALPASFFFNIPILQPFQTRAYTLAYINPVGNSIPINPNGIPIICHSIGCLPRPNVLPGTLNIITPDGRSSSLFPFEVTLPSRNLEMPAAHHYSFIYEQQLNKNFATSIGYIGTTGRNLLRFTTPNLGPSTTVAVGGIGIGQYLGPRSIGFSASGSQSRPVSGIGTVYLFETTASSIYNSLQTQLRGRLSNNLNFQLSYTLSKVTDNVSDVFDLAGAYALPQNSLTFEGERAPANFDVRHRWTYQAIYNVPQFKSNSFLRVLTNKLQITSTGRFHSGQPFTVNSTIDVNLDGNLTDRLVTTQGLEVTGDRSQPLRLTTDNPFSLLAAFGTDGSVKRNSFRAGSVLELDLSIIKQFSIYDRRLSFRTDIFNFINRANFGIPVRLLEAPGFGKATGTITPGRRVQFSLKYDF